MWLALLASSGSILLALTFASPSSSLASLIDKPIIGILSLPFSTEADPSVRSYFPASYVKFIESGGGRVVPILYDDSDDEIIKTLNSINGVLFTGGDATLDRHHPYFNTIELIVNYVLAANHKGDVFPLWGTCLGFESIITAIANDTSILSHFVADDFAGTLQFQVGVHGRKMFPISGVDSMREINLLSSLEVTYNHHSFGVSPDAFVRNPRLSKVLRMLSTTLDKTGKPFVSMFEGIDAPIFGVQFHPEKVLWEMNDREKVPHTQEARDANQYFGNFFVDQTRRGSPWRRFQSPAIEKAMLIYNYDPVYTGKTGGDMSNFEQCYFFQSSIPRGLGNTPVATVS